MDELLRLLLGPLGLTVSLLFIVYARFKGWWVDGPTHGKVVTEKDEWKTAALRGTKIAETVVERLPKNGGES